MVDIEDAFPGFGVGEIAPAVAFYREALGLPVDEDAMPGSFTLTLPSGQQVFAYERPGHVPAEFTILNFVVADIDAAVDALNAAGVTTKLYSGDEDFGTDERGIARSDDPSGGPAGIAWFRDPSGNVLSVIQQ
ncbi:VOC family protein [Agromyces seonyuensis]|uniref:VOC family protein n=1 Tax=Agromyces seonyuensis TaxID=2662446 RepID=A0A6I4P2N4_9MICO|nr:VOC family protein [Agromyces seonyuensis]MWB98359.1 VOC family protein [Agromyces seonyuensis]